MCLEQNIYRYIYVNHECYVLESLVLIGLEQANLFIGDI